MTHKPPYIVDGLQYCRWDRGIFEQMRTGQLSAVHVTIAYWETFRETVANMGKWNRMFEQHSDLIFHGRTGDDIRRAVLENKTAIFFGFQHCSPMEEDIDLIQVLYDLGARFMQLSYNNQSLLATGCYETEDPGVTRFGKQAIAEMNRVGLVIDMSHSAERSTLDAIEISARPIAITHANPSFWEPALRNKSDDVLKALSASGGMLGLSLYPFHLKDKSDCTIESFSEMVARAADLIGTEHLGIGSDLCQGHPDSVVEWMRNGRWTRDLDFGEGNKSQSGWPDPVSWFANNEDFGNVTQGLADIGFNTGEIDGIMGGNWVNFYDTSFGPENA
ncbi:MAG: membrane dipeptidase [Rhodospirillales bacterium]|jgi:membrane dipeptidase|nr:membrane dipeptidase [Rhodospirillales bacterium]MBT4040954.1 membrane dipeptidase [Rhodospirillales bacterium]MBT4625644.1 membrane dipeptidase [Rhodospirillales bacterium]MBT5350187.1 membrane dipeptidase [Rhodospirillales bacterium]MBT5522031.1 membrane dipeptidase [Rhodospirillales bacterium]